MASRRQRRYKGFTLPAEEDASLYRVLLRGKFAISGFTNEALQQLLPDQTSA